VEKVQFGSLHKMNLSGRPVGDNDFRNRNTGHEGGRNYTRCRSAGQKKLESQSSLQRARGTDASPAHGPLIPSRRTQQREKGEVGAAARGCRSKGFEQKITALEYSLQVENEGQQKN